MEDQPKPVAPAPVDHEPFAPMACCGRERDKDGGPNPHCECPAELKPKPVATEVDLIALLSDLSEIGNCHCSVCASGIAYAKVQAALVAYDAEVRALRAGKAEATRKAIYVARLHNHPIGDEHMGHAIAGLLLALGIDDG